MSDLRLPGAAENYCDDVEAERPVGDIVGCEEIAGGFE